MFLRTAGTVLCWLVVGMAIQASTPALAVRAAWEDARKLPPQDGPHTRYLSLLAVPAAERELFLKVLAFHVNSLSREAVLEVPRLVTPDLLRVDLRWYGWSAKTWELLLDVPEPYFHVQITKEVVEDRVWWKGGVDRKGEYFAPGWYGGKKKKVQTAAHAPWALEDAEATQALATAGLGQQKVDEYLANHTSIGKLAAWSKSNIPIVRADWFFVQTAISLDRKAGYYDFLGWKSIKDVEDLAGLNKETATRIRREVAAIVRDSGVAFNNRQIFRFGAASGGYWETRDVLKSTGDQNAIEKLDKDFVFAATEVYMVLPNDLFGLAAGDNKGNIQRSVPDGIAGDKQTEINDTKIHSGLSCIACHVEGLRKFDDWGRRVFSIDGGNRLQSTDYEKYKRLKQLYLGPLEEKRVADVAVYAAAVKRVNGLTVEDNARAYSKTWRQWFETPVKLEQAAAEWGTTPAVVLERFRKYASPQGAGQLDPVLSELLTDRPTIRREHFEEVYAKGQIILRGGIVP